MSLSAAARTTYSYDIKTTVSDLAFHLIPFWLFFPLCVLILLLKPIQLFALYFYTYKKNPFVHKAVSHI